METPWGCIVDRCLQGCNTLFVLFIHCAQGVSCILQMLLYFVPFYLKLLIFLSSAEGECDAAEVNAWMPSLDDLKEHDKNWYIHVQGLASVLSLGARAFERLGRDDDAIAAAQAGIELNKKKARHARTNLLVHF